MHRLGAALVVGGGAVEAHVHGAVWVVVGEGQRPRMTLVGAALNPVGDGGDGGARARREPLARLLVGLARRRLPERLARLGLAARQVEQALAVACLAREQHASLVHERDGGDGAGGRRGAAVARLLGRWATRDACRAGTALLAVGLLSLLALPTRQHMTPNFTLGYCTRCASQSSRNFSCADPSISHSMAMWVRMRLSPASTSGTRASSLTSGAMLSAAKGRKRLKQLSGHLAASGCMSKYSHLHLRDGSRTGRTRPSSDP